MNTYASLLTPTIWVVDLTVASLRLMDYIYAEIVPRMQPGMSREDLHGCVEKLAAQVIIYSAANAIGAYIQKDPFSTPDRHHQIVLHHSALLAADLPGLNAATLHNVSESMAIHAEGLAISAIVSVIPNFDNSEQVKIHQFSASLSRTPCVIVEGYQVVPA